MKTKLNWNLHSPDLSYPQLIFLFFRTGSYELSEAEAVERGTKIVLHLKGDCYDYAKENIVKGM